MRPRALSKTFPSAGLHLQRHAVTSRSDQDRGKGKAGCLYIAEGIVVRGLNVRSHRSGQLSYLSVMATLAQWRGQNCALLRTKELGDHFR